MKKEFTISEQFIIKFYNFFKLQTRAQQMLVDDKELARAIVEDI